MHLTYSQKRLEQHSLHVAESLSEGEPTLVMLHGVTRRWQTFVPIVSAMVSRHRVLLVDFRGHGESDRVRSAYHVVDYVEDICQLIERYVEGTVSLYGHSLGAMTAAGVAARLGDRVTAVVMEDPPLHTMGTRIGSTPLLSYFTGVSKFAGDSRAAGLIAKDLGNVEFSDPASGKLVRIGDTRDAAQLRFAASCLKKLDPAVFDSILKSEWLAGFDIDRVFGGLSCPALLLQADYDAGGMLTDEDAQYVCGLNENVVRVQFDGIPHGIHWTSTVSLLNTVLPFLESVRT